MSTFVGIPRYDAVSLTVSLENEPLNFFEIRTK